MTGKSCQSLLLRDRVQRDKSKQIEILARSTTEGEVPKWLYDRHVTVEYSADGVLEHQAFLVAFATNSQLAAISNRKPAPIPSVPAGPTVPVKARPTKPPQKILKMASIL